MENKIKRRSSIKRMNKDDDQDAPMAAASINMNQKRISFSGRKSVREFHKEEEPKTWNYSYDISDSTSAADRDSQVNSLAVATSTVFDLSLPHNPISTSIKLEAHMLSNSALCTTMEFIDKSHKIEVLQVENSLDITLLQNEHRQSPWPQSQQFGNGAAVRNVVTDGEIAMNTSGDSATGPVRDVDMFDYHQQTILLHEDTKTILENGIKETELCSTLKDDRPLHHVTTYMDETIEPDREDCADVKGLGRRTLQLAQNMDVSDENVIECQQNDKENMQPPDLAPSQPGSSNKANNNAKVLVRKICPPNVIPKNSNPAAVEMRRMQNYQKHLNKSNVAKKTESVLPFVVLSSRNAGSDSEFLSTDLHSPLFSTEFVGSQRRQSKESFSAKTALGASLTLVSKEAEDVSLIGTCDTDKKSKTQELGLESIPEIAINSTATKTYKHRALRFSEVDDMLLDNTSFLTHAKLGDETTSRNNSKCSNTNRLVPMYLNNEGETLYGTRAGCIQLSPQTINESALQNDLSYMNSKQRLTFQQDVREKDNCFDHEDPGAIYDDKLRSAEFITKSKPNFQTHSKSMPIIEVNNETVKEVNDRKRQTLYLNSDIEVDGDLTMTFDVPASTANPPPLAFKEPKTHHFITNKDMALDESMVIADLESCTIRPKTQVPSAELISNEVNQPPLAFKQRKTIHFITNKDMALDESMHITDLECSTIRPKRQVQSTELISNEVNPPPLAFKERKTIHFITNKDMALDESMVITDLESCTIRPKTQVQSAELISNEVNQPPLAFKQRKTIHFITNKDMELDESMHITDLESCTIRPKRQVQSTELISNEVNQPCLAFKERKKIHFITNEDMELDESMHITDLESCTIRPKTQVQSAELISNEVNQPPLAFKQRKTIHFITNKDMELDESMHITDLESCTIRPKRQVQSTELISNEVNQPCLAFKERKTIHFITNKDMALDESMLITDLECSTNRPKTKVQSAELISNEVAGRTLEDSLFIELEKTRASICKPNKPEKRQTGHNADFKNQLYESPPESAGPVVPTTPHRSIIEFESFERAATMEQEQFDQGMETNESKRLFDVFGVQLLENVKNMVPTKRLTSTLTPNLPLSKKRATLVFEDCNMDESILGMHCQATRPQTVLFTTDIAIEHECTHNAVLIDDTCSDTRLYQSPRGGTENNTSIAMEMTAAVNEKSLRFSLLKDTKESLPVKPEIKRQSRIPKAVSIEKRSLPFSAHIASPRTEDHFFTSHSLRTIETARRGTSGGQREESLLPLPIDVDIVEDSVKQMEDKLDDNPITISDVSKHFLAHRQSVKMGTEHTNYHATKDVSDDNLGKSTPVLANFKKDYINLTRDNSLLHIVDMDDIDQTRLSLVETVLDADDDNSNSVVEQQMNLVGVPNKLVACDTFTHGDSKTSNTRVEKPIQQLEVTGLLADCASLTELREQKGMCRKCKRCQETILDETASSVIAADSFGLLTGNMLPEKGFNRMKQLRQGPNIGDAIEYWQRRSLDRSMCLTNFIAEPEMLIELDLGDDANMDEDYIDVDRLIRDYQNKTERCEEEIIAEIGPMTFLGRQTFIQKLDHLLQGVDSTKANWIFDYQMQDRKLLRFTHKLIATLSIDLLYEEKDAFGYQIVVQQVRLQRARFPKKNWKPIDFLVDFQLLLELPFDLKVLCVTSDATDVFGMLEQIDRIIVSVSQMGRSLWQLVCSEQASLIRDSEKTFVRKVERHISAPFSKVEHSEFRIELMNARKVCFRDIASPPLHNFHERVQFLPVGLDFLRIFLRCPTKYLKSTNPDSTN